MIIAIKGSHDSGKTCFIEKLLRKLSEYMVVVIKSSQIDIIDTALKDTYRYREAGAVTRIICGKKESALFAKEMSLEEAINFAKKLLPDVILVEGYKSTENIKCTLIDIEKNPDVESVFHEIADAVKKKRICVFVDGKELLLNSFVEEIMYSTIKAMVASLKEGEGKQIEVMLNERS